MIKKIVKNIVIISLILNSLLCLIFDTYIFLKNETVLKEISEKSVNSSNMQPLTFFVQEGKSNYDFMKEQELLGQRYILSSNFTISIFSLIVAVLISLIISMDESKFIKLILIFLICNIMINTIFTVINHELYLSSFITGYILVFKELFIPYTLIFILLLCIKVFIIQNSIKRINKLLNK